MTNLLYETPPDFVEIGGNRYSVVTDFRDWLRFFDLQSDNSIQQTERVLMMLEWYRDVPPIRSAEDAEEALDALVAFATRQEPDSEERAKGKQSGNASTERLLSWSYDSPYIYAAFLAVYGIDLDKVETMHWHKFLALFDALPEDTPIKKRIAYRGVNLAAIKDKNERKRIRKIKDAIRIPQPDLDAYQCGDYF